MNDNQELELLRIKDVKKMIPFSTAKIYALMAKNEFPKQKKFGGASLWLKSEIVDYIKEKIN